MRVGPVCHQAAAPRRTVRLGPLAMGATHRVDGNTAVGVLRPSKALDVPPTSPCPHCKT